jgi:hypothetical protein
MALYLCESILGFIMRGGVGMDDFIQRVVPKEVAMLMEFTTTKGNVLIVNSFLPLFILIFKLETSIYA